MNEVPKSILSKLVESRRLEESNWKGTKADSMTQAQIERLLVDVTNQLKSANTLESARQQMYTILKSVRASQVSLKAFEEYVDDSIARDFEVEDSPRDWKKIIFDGFSDALQVAWGGLVGLVDAEESDRRYQFIDDVKRHTIF